MSDELRQLLYYPLGIIPSFFFTLRVLIQWIQSEKHKKSYVGHTFWRLSLSGNFFLILHYIIQIQYPFAILQAGNAVISWRNLNLMKSDNQCTIKTTILVFLGSFTLVTLIFIAQSHFIIGEIDWVRTPTKLFDTARHYNSPMWHIFGTMGGVLFSSRFWFQWWKAEQVKHSELGRTFWWLSIFGSFVLLIYFLHIKDTVNIILYSCTFVPYARNLILMKQKKVYTRSI